MNPKQLVLIALVLGSVGVAAILVTHPASKSANTNMAMSPAASSRPAATARPNAVNIDNYNFGPAALAVKKGTTVVWTNHDQAPHAIASDDMATGAPMGPLFGKGETFSFTFDTVGTFNYHCDPHPYMHGSVTVTE